MRNKSKIGGREGGREVRFGGKERGRQRMRFDSTTGVREGLRGRVGGKEEKSSSGREHTSPLYLSWLNNIQCLLE